MSQFRTVVPSDTALLDLAVATGLFTLEEAQELLGAVPEDFHAGRLAAGHQARVWEDAAASIELKWANTATWA